jgi:glycine betaine catabolism B
MEKIRTGSYKNMKLRLLRKIQETNDCYTFVFSSENQMHWKAGQYLHYTLPHEPKDDRGDERWFTISSAPFENEIHLTTRFDLVKGSSFKKSLFALEPGDEIEVDPPEGTFSLDDKQDNVVFVAGGIGITPFRSILAECAQAKRQLHVTLLYANRDENNVVFKSELESFRQENPNLQIQYFYGDNYISKEVIQTSIEKYNHPLLYVSGPEPMVESFKAMFEEMGIDTNEAKFDYFPGYTSK